MNYQILAIILVLFTAVALYTDNTGNFFIFLILAFILISLFFWNRGRKIREQSESAIKLKRCESCDKEISLQAESCPNCGAITQLKKDRATGANIFYFVATAVIIIVILSY